MPFRLYAKAVSVSWADRSAADADAPIAATQMRVCQAQPKCAVKTRLEVTVRRTNCVNESVTYYPNPTLCMPQPALLYVTAETLVSRLMWQISTATLLFNPVILHQRVMKNLFFALC